MADHSKRSSSGRISPRTKVTVAKKSEPAGQVRIVAGLWRGRKLNVVQAAGLRPTGDRVRETLFNWLQMHIPGKRCLDLYAGSGALGLEAASRGAATVALVESSAVVANQLRDTLTQLQAGDGVSLHEMSAEQYLDTQPQPFDLVFVDPPFDLQIHQNIVNRLVPAFLKPGALVYIELPTSASELLRQLPDALGLEKEKRFGDVTVFLLRYDK